MDAPVGWLVERARALRQDYRWASAALFQRRLRVTRRMAEYLMKELDDSRTR